MYRAAKAILLYRTEDVELAGESSVRCPRIRYEKSDRIELQLKPVGKLLDWATEAGGRSREVLRGTPAVHTFDSLQLIEFESQLSSVYLDTVYPPLGNKGRSSESMCVRK